ncbi:hypothetical protein D9613_003864 [Agrocybe pediades]|uniref:DUF7598 domain-containing protein n=1 Tax=Agrocybe pediades TaxID=84607 RepID=A0A8H4VIJ9_9AGAR|nr:hypothetical protein D9613_003864 [Agrocybe pediades]
MLPPRAYTFIGLNIIRILSIIALLLVFASNVVTLANDIKAVNRFMQAGKQVQDSNTTNSTVTEMLDMDYIMGSTVPNQPAGAFWAVLNRLFIIFQAIVLILSEFGFPSKFFNRFFPVLGKDFGLGALGVIQMLIGAAILSHRVDTFTLVSAFFLFSIGCLNILAGLIFRESAKVKRSITSWKEQAKGVIPTHVGPVNITPLTSTVLSSAPYVSRANTGVSADAKMSAHGPADFPFVGSPAPSSATLVSRSNTGVSFDGGILTKEKLASSMGFGRQAEKAAALRGYSISKPEESLPRYAPARTHSRK